MDFERMRRWRLPPAVSLASSVGTAFGAGYCCAIGCPGWALLLLASILCGLLAIKSIRSAGRQIRFVMDATLSGDFSYRFPTTAVDSEVREINEKLNRIVERFEQMNYAAGQHEAFLRRVMDQSDVGSVVADAEGNVIYHNDAALRLLDRKALTHCCQMPGTGSEQMVIKRSELTVRERRFTVLTINDLRREMQDVEVKSWEKLTRVLTHEIMNSLTPIQSIAENMTDRMRTVGQDRESDSFVAGLMAKEQDMSEAFATISSSSRALMQFVKNFREFTKLPKPKLRTVYLKPLLESCVRIGEQYVKGKEIRISVLCFPPDVMVYTDESLLNGVIVNIVKNAIEANPSAVWMEAELKADETVEIRISNNGEYISEEIATHIFTPFFTTKSHGSGIGLSLARRVITHLGGTLTLDNKPRTCFTIRI